MVKDLCVKVRKYCNRCKRYNYPKARYCNYCGELITDEKLYYIGYFITRVRQLDDNTRKGDRTAHSDIYLPPLFNDHVTHYDVFSDRGGSFLNHIGMVGGAFGGDEPCPNIPKSAIVKKPSTRRSMQSTNAANIL